LVHDLGQPSCAICGSAEYRKSAEFRKLNPVGKVPAMTDGDLTMFETGLKGTRGTQKRSPPLGFPP
jgi:hypothetical protein